MKKLLFTALLLTSLSCAQAKSVVLTLNNGTEIYYLLGGEKNPMMRFVDGKMTMNDDTYEFKDLRNFRISETDDPAGIEQLLRDNAIEYHNGQVVVKCGKASAIRVFATDGKEVKPVLNEANGCTLVDLNSLNAGTYVIRFGNSSLKVHKR